MSSILGISINLGLPYHQFIAMPNREYNCFALFYKLNDVHPCRKSLDIIERNQPWHSKRQWIIVMLNPGSCGDKNESENKNDHPLKVDPDPTLHRIINFLETNKIVSARVINLSDLREKDSKELFKRIENLENQNLFSHSIFHQSRVSELNKYVPQKAKVLFACGMNKKSKKFLDQAQKYFRDNGCQIVNKNEKYYHPLMRPKKKGETWDTFIQWNN